MGNKAAKKNILTEDDVKMLEDNTDLKREKILEWFEDFKKECKNGELDKKNFTRFYKELMPNHSNADKFCEFVFKAFDKDHSGSIDFTEFLLSFSITARGNVEE
jgi:Ca2+-binding EF-hand superfamily protein